MTPPLFRAAVVTLLCLAAPATASAQTVNQRVLRDACLNDARTFCSGVQPGGGRLLICLDQNRDKLAEACKAALPSSQAIKARTGG